MALTFMETICVPIKFLLSAVAFIFLFQNVTISCLITYPKTPSRDNIVRKLCSCLTVKTDDR